MPTDATDATDGNGYRGTRFLDVCESVLSNLLLAVFLIRLGHEAGVEDCRSSSQPKP